MSVSVVLAIPAAFPALVQGVVQALLYERFREFIEQDLPKIAEEQERRLTAEMSTLAMGDDFFGLKVVDASATTVTLFKSLSNQKAIYPIFDKFPPRTEAIPGLVFDLIRVSVEIKRSINLTNSKKPVLDFVDIAEFTIEITIKHDPYTFRIGGGFDKLRNLEQYLVGIDFAAPALRFRGYLAKGNPGGFIIWVHSGLPVPVPLGATPFGLYGIGLEYGERFVPRLTKDLPKDPIEEFGKATVREYAAWARSNVLEKWTPVSRDVRVYGITADIGDLSSNGSVVKTQATGLTYLSWGPTLVLEGFLKLLETEIATVVGAIDFRSKSLFFSANSHVVVFEKVLEFDGSVVLLCHKMLRI